MKLIIALVALVSSNCYADMYRCPATSGTVYQEKPCANGGGKVQIDAPQSAASTPAGDQDKLAKDKAYIDERVKARVFDREKSESSVNIMNCDREVDYYLNQADAALRPSNVKYLNNPAGNIAAQTEYLQQQTVSLSWQNKAAAKRNQCSALRSEHNSRFGR